MLTASSVFIGALTQLAAAISVSAVAQRTPIAQLVAGAERDFIELERRLGPVTRARR